MGLEKTIDTIYETDNMELIYYWVTRCLSNSTGKRKWNKFICERRIKDVITFSDEAFAMIVLENNAKKWRDTVEYPSLKKKDLPKALYTEGEEGNGWSEAGLISFIELLKSQVKRRKNDHSGGTERRKKIEDKVLKQRKRIRDGLSMSAKRKRWEDNETEEARLINMQKKKKLRKLFVSNVKWRGH